MIGFMGRVIAKPLLIPCLIGGAGLFYGSHEVAFITADTLFSSVTGQSRPGRNLKCFWTSVSTAAVILLFRGRGSSLQKPVKFHVNTVIAAGFCSAVSRAVAKEFF